MRWLIYSQAVILFGSGLVFPFYVIFIRETGANFTEFGVAYALFALASALTHKYVGDISDRKGRKVFLVANSWGTAVLLLFFPLVTSIYQVYALQVLLGMFGAMQKTSEKAIIADMTSFKKRGKEIGIYHGWISIASALAIMAGGYLIDLFTLSIIFYLGSIILFLGGLATLKINEH